MSDGFSAESAFSIDKLSMSPLQCCQGAFDVSGAQEKQQTSRTVYAVHLHHRGKGPSSAFILCGSQKGIRGEDGDPSVAPHLWLKH